MVARQKTAFIKRENIMVDGRSILGELRPGDRFYLLCSKAWNRLFGIGVTFHFERSWGLSIGIFGGKIGVDVFCGT